MARFEAQDVVMELVRSVRETIARVAKHDRKLADELRRAVQSVALNLAEGNRRTGRDRIQAWKVAAGSADEARTAMQVAEAWGYVGASDVARGLEMADRVCAILWRLTHPRR